MTGRTVMLAAVTEAPEKLVVRTLPVAEPGPGEVVVAVRAVGICGTDVQVHRGTFAAPLPLVLGHEYAGTVAAVGTGVSGLAPGMRVAGTPGWPCGRCGSCRGGDPARCTQRLVLGRTVDGAFAEYVTVPASTLMPLPDEVSFVAAQAMVTVATAHHAVDRLGEVAGEDVALIGPGHAGLILLQVLRAAGARSVTVFGTRDERLDRALSCGAVRVCNVREAPVAERFDVVAEAAGTPSALLLALRLAALDARVLVYGITSAPVHDFPAAEIYHKELRLIGSHGGRGGHGPALEALHRGAVQAESLVTHRFALCDADAAMRTATDRRSGALRVVIEP